MSYVKRDALWSSGTWVIAEVPLLTKPPKDG